MEGSNQDDKSSFASIKQDLDKTYDSPEQLAGKVWLVLKEYNFTSWELVCFCMVYMMKITSVYEWFKPMCKSFHQNVYLAHYRAHSELGLKPRDET
jgi:hypothetical protein